MIAAIKLVANQLVIAGKYIRIIWTWGLDETKLEILEEGERFISNVILTRKLPFIADSYSNIKGFGRAVD
jgi:hypothetical protein